MKKTQAYILISSCFVLVISFLVMMAWYLDPFLPLPRGTFVKFNSCLALSLASIVLILRNRNQKTSVFESVFSSIVLLIGFMTFTEYVTGLNLGIDQLFVTDIRNKDSLNPGRMSPLSAFSFFSLGSALLFRRFSHFFVIPAFIIPVIALVGYFYKVRDFYQVGEYTRMSWMVASFFLLLSSGVLIQSSSRLIKILSSSSSIGISTRKLLVPAFFLPIVLGWVRIRGQNEGLFDLEFGTALMVTILCLSLSFMILKMAMNEETNSRVLQDSEKKFRKLANELPQLVWTTDVYGKSDFINERWTVYTGQSAEEFFATRPNAFIHPDDLKNVQDAWREAVRTSQRFETEIRIRNQAGEYRWFVTRSVPMFDISGNLTGWIGTSTDIHSHKLIENKLAEAVKTRDQFMSVASHELKTPLTSLKLQNQLFQRILKKDKPHSPEDLNRISNYIDKQVTRIARLVDNMMDLSRIQSGKMLVTPELFNVCDLVKDIVERFVEEMGTANIPVKAEFCDPVVGVWDSLKIEQVVLNLLTNAMKYGGGKEIFVKVSCDDDLVRIMIEDQGQGIATEDQVKIFDRFERLVEPATVSGLGLGLFISKEIVELHNGRIWVESEIRKGSRFQFELPRK